MVMNELKVGEIFHLHSSSIDWIQELAKRSQRAPLTRTERQSLLEDFKEIDYEEYEKLNRKVAISAKTLRGLLILLTYRKSRQIPRAIYLKAFQDLDRDIFEALHETVFVGIGPRMAEYFQQKALFGDIVKRTASDEINNEILAAGNCLALGLNTASVFHSLRAAELGMRKLVSRLKLKIVRDGGKVEIKPEDATCEELVRSVRLKMESEKQKPIADRKIKKHFKDYENLASQFDLLRSDRNNVMHVRGDYKGSEALGILERVKDFMQKLAKRTSLK